MKGFTLLLFAAMAVLAGVAIAILLIRKKRMSNLVDFDDFDTAVSDEEFEHFFGGEASSKDDEDDD
jgi:type III secretory pathway component EscV